MTHRCPRPPPAPGNKSHSPGFRRNLAMAEYMVIPAELRLERIVNQICRHYLPQSKGAASRESRVLGMKVSGLTEETMYSVVVN